MNIIEQYNSLQEYDKDIFIDDNLDELFSLIIEDEPKQFLSNFDGETIIEILQEHAGVSATELLDAIGDIENVRKIIEYSYYEQSYDDIVYNPYQDLPI